MRNIHAEDFDIFVFHSEAIDVGHLAPDPQRDDQIDPLFQADALDTEHCGHVDNANASHFHVVAGDFRTGAHDLASIQKRDFGDVIGDQTIASFDESEHRFAFADSTLPAN